MMPTKHLDLSRFVSTSRLSQLQHVADLSSEFGFPACLVGGFVRDALLEKPVNDFDIVIEGDATKLGRALIKRFGGNLTVHAPFKTATWFLPDNPADFIDLISARSETYAQPAALPTVKLGSLDEDLRRRDFTINAMAVRLNGEGVGALVDPLGGRDDLEHGLMRVLHSSSFIDDPTRLFRLVRYAERYGLNIESQTEALVPSALGHVDQLSPERLRHELDLIFEEENFLPMLEKLWAYRILQQVKPDLPFDEATRARLDETRLGFSTTRNPVPSGISQIRNRLWIAWLMGLSGKEIRALGKRMHFTADLLKQCISASLLLQALDSFAGLRPSECVARLDKLPAESILVASSCVPNMGLRSLLQKYLTEWKGVKPGTTGEELMLLGVPFGPRIGEILWRLRAAWLDGELTTTAGEHEFLDRLMQEWGKKK